MATAPATPELKNRNRRVGLYALIGALAMLGLGYAAVPLYRLFCQVTGFAGTTMRASAQEAAGVKATTVPISVRFDANTDPDLPWQFKPLQVTQNIRIGARSFAAYSAKNLSDQPVSGRASFNVSPDAAGKYFTKVECFCFTQQTLQPGQEVRMPVTYYIDPAILDDPEARDIEQITLSYTFHVDRSGSDDSGVKPLDRAENAR